MNRIQIQVLYEDGSTTELNLPEKSWNSVDIYILNDDNTILDKKSLCLPEKDKLQFA